MSTLNKLIVILGATASGKSELALKLARKFNGEIISADSRQIYKEMIIATASPIAEIKKYKISASDEKKQNNIIKFRNKTIKAAMISGIPHHLLHFVEPKQKFSVAEYKELAIKIIRNIQNRGKIPILVGGTGLYISTIINNIEIPKVKPNLKLRRKLEKTPLIALLKRLKKVDIETFNKIDKNNKRRLIRALEVTILSGKPFSEQREKGSPLFNILEMGIDVPRKKLYKRINQRIKKMIKSGLIQETKKLSKKYSWQLPSMSGIGYKEIGMYLRGKISLEKARELMEFATHRYAKRQITWFKRDKNIHWIKSFSEANKIFAKFIKK